MQGTRSSGSVERLKQLFVAWWQRHVQVVDQAAVLEQMTAQGGLSHGYFFLVFASCGIATLGLLLSSPAVVIGAMLVAPLMGPIVLFGFAIAKTDVVLAKRSALALAFGVLGALLASILIVKLSPFIPPTPEILARTQPNLFDLLVAIFSGLVAGYAVIRRQGGAIAGVAIATALMPPLAVTGYGLATGALDIFRGAFFLFLTNMLAIAFSVAFMAIWYGFGRLYTSRPLLWQTIIAGFVLALLSVPLVRTLEDSVRTTRVSKQVEDVLRAEVLARKAALTSLNINVSKQGQIGVTAVVLTPRYEQGFQGQMKRKLEQSLAQPVQLSLHQILEGRATLQAQDNSARLRALLQQQDTAVAQAEMEKRLRAAIPFPVALGEVDERAHRAGFLIAADYGGDLRTLWALERHLRTQYPDWQISIIPPPRPLEPIPFEHASAALSPAGRAALELDLWALNRWGVRAVRNVGQGSLNENGRKTPELAMARAETVAALLRQAGLQVSMAVDYPSAEQRRKEEEQGAAAYRVALLYPHNLEPGEAPSTSPAPVSVVPARH
ncbi:MAG: DUF389 domain-containing protein [Pseudomonadota bacterium]